MRWLLENAGGRKFLIGALAIAATTVLAAMKVLGIEDWSEALRWIVGIVVGGIAVEDGVRAIAERSNTTGAKKK